MDFEGQARVSVVGADSVVLFDLDGDGAFDDFGLGFAGAVVSGADFLLQCGDPFSLLASVLTIDARAA